MVIDVMRGRLEGTRRTDKRAALLAGTYGGGASFSEKGVWGPSLVTASIHGVSIAKITNDAMQQQPG